MKFSVHAYEMLKERNISEALAKSAIDNPDWKCIGEDNNVHYFKTIKENEGRVLRVIVNEKVVPTMVVTVFFDRRARR